VPKATHAPQQEAEKSVALETDCQIEPLARSVCSFTEPPPKVATAGAAFLPPLSGNAVCRTTISKRERSYLSYYWQQLPVHVGADAPARVEQAQGPV